MEYNVYKDEFLEFLATPGITKKNREEVKVYGQTGYTSELLRSKLKLDLKKHAPSYSINIFETLIDSGDMVPVFVTKSLWEYLSKMKKIDPSVGLYSSKDKKIFIFMESILKYTKLKVFASTKPGTELIKTIFHEAMHMAHDRNPKAFFNFNRVPLLKFNSHVYFNFFEIKGADNKKKAAKILDDWNRYMVEKGKNRAISYNEFHKTFNRLTDFSSLKQDKIEILAKDVWQTMYFYIADKQFYSYGYELYKLMGEAYKKRFKYNVEQQWVNEEIIVYDGIIAKLAEHNPNLPYVKKSLRLTV